MMHDIAIIGGGPAGLSAAIYAARKNLDVIVISKDIGGQAVQSSDVENYLGYHLITGAELIKKFEEHLKDYKIEIISDGVTSIKKSGKFFKIAGKKSYNAKSIIIASGKIPRRLGVSGEKEYLGKGVTYCATCDAPLFAGKTVVVAGGGNSALDAAIQLMKIAKKIYLININEQLAGDEIMKSKVTKATNVEVMNSTKIIGIKGKKFVDSVIIEKGKKKILPVDGIFVEIGSIPSVDFADIVEKNERNEIKIHRTTEQMDENMTNIPGIFAAGDVTDIPEKQIIVAAGEGAKAAMAASYYLAKNNP